MAEEERNVEYEAKISANAFDNKHNDYFFNVDLIVYQEDGRYIAQCPALDLASSGENYIEAIQNFYEAFQLHVECCIEMGTLLEDFRNHGWAISANAIEPPRLSVLAQKDTMKQLLDSDVKFDRVKAPINIPNIA